MLLARADKAVLFRRHPKPHAMPARPTPKKNVETQRGKKTASKAPPVTDQKTVL